MGKRNEPFGTDLLMEGWHTRGCGHCDTLRALLRRTAGLPHFGAGSEARTALGCRPFEFGHLTATTAGNARSAPAFRHIASPVKTGSRHRARGSGGEAPVSRLRRLHDVNPELNLPGQVAHRTS